MRRIGPMRQIGLIGPGELLPRGLRASATSHLSPITSHFSQARLGRAGYDPGDNGSEIRRFNLTALDKIIRAMLD